MLYYILTGTEKDLARSLLEACHGNLEMAIGMHMDGGGASEPGPANHVLVTQHSVIER